MMRIEDTEISCGIQQLVSVGETPTDAEYENAMMDYCEEDEGGCFVIASLPWDWKRSIQFLKGKGFKRVGGIRTNPNTSNKIVVLLKSFTIAERKKLRKNKKECRDCSDIIPPRRVLCDGCKEEAKRERRAAGRFRFTPQVNNNNYYGLRY